MEDQMLTPPSRNQSEAYAEAGGPDLNLDPNRDLDRGLDHNLDPVLISSLDLDLDPGCQTTQRQSLPGPSLMPDWTTAQGCHSPPRFCSSWTSQPDACLHSDPSVQRSQLAAGTPREDYPDPTTGTRDGYIFDPTTRTRRDGYLDATTRSGDDYSNLSNEKGAGFSNLQNGQSAGYSDLYANHTGRTKIQNRRRIIRVCWVVSLSAFFSVCLFLLLGLALLHLYGKVQDQAQLIENLRNEAGKGRQQENGRVSSGLADSDALKLLGFNGGDLKTVGHPLKRHRRDAGYFQSMIEEYHAKLPRVHLRGVGRGMARAALAEEEYLHAEVYLLWQQHGGFHRMGVTLVHAEGHHDKIKAIQIDTPGVYMVYSQVVINGSDDRTYRRDCTHQMVVTRHNLQQDTVLTSGFLTQDGEGLGYNGSTVPFPRDSSLQMGLFRLYRQTEVRVRIPIQHDHDCRHVNFATDIHATYFGLYKID